MLSNERRTNQRRIDVYLEHDEWLVFCKDGHPSEEALEGTLRSRVQDIPLSSMLQLHSSRTFDTDKTCAGCVGYQHAGDSHFAVGLCERSPDVRKCYY